MDSDRRQRVQVVHTSETLVRLEIIDRRISTEVQTVAGRRVRLTGLRAVFITPNELCDYISIAAEIVQELD